MELRFVPSLGHALLCALARSQLYLCDCARLDFCGRRSCLMHEQLPIRRSGVSNRCGLAVAVKLQTSAAISTSTAPCSWLGFFPLGHRNGFRPPTLERLGLRTGKIGSNEPPHAWPSPARTLATALHLAVPQFRDFVAKWTQATHVAGISEVVLPSPNNSPQPSTYIAERNMPHRDELQLDFSQRQTHAFCNRYALDRKPSHRFGCTTTMGEAEEVEGLRFTIASFSPTLRSETTEFNQSCLFWMQRKSKLSETLTCSYSAQVTPSMPGAGCRLSS